MCASRSSLWRGPRSDVGPSGASDGGESSKNVSRYFLSSEELFFRDQLARSMLVSRAASLFTVSRQCSSARSTSSIPDPSA